MYPGEEPDFLNWNSEAERVKVIKKYVQQNPDKYPDAPQNERPDTTSQPTVETQEQKLQKMKHKLERSNTTQHGRKWDALKEHMHTAARKAIADEEAKK